MSFEKDRNTLIATARVRDQRLRGRRAVFEAAQTLFALQGYSATPLAQIGVAVGLRAGSLYNHIRSKQELLLGIAAEAHQVLRRETFQAFARQRPPASGLKVAAFCHAHAHAEAPWAMLVLAQDLACVDGPLPTRVRALQDDIRAQLVQLVRQGQEAGAFDPVPAEPVADLVMGAGPVVARRVIAAPRLHPQELAREHADLALRLVGCAA